MVQKKSKKEPAISGNQALKSIFENANLDDGFKDIIQNLLTLNPYFRWTASECLAHPFFDDVRLENTQLSSSKKLKLAVDQDEAFDYENEGNSMFSRTDHISNLFAEVDLIHQKWLNKNKIGV